MAGAARSVMFDWLIAELIVELPIGVLVARYAIGSYPASSKSRLGAWCVMVIARVLVLFAMQRLLPRAPSMPIVGLTDIGTALVAVIGFGVAFAIALAVLSRPAVLRADR